MPYNKESFIFSNSPRGFVYIFIILALYFLTLVVYKSRTKESIKKYSLIIFPVTAIMGFVLYFWGYMENKNGVFISCLRAVFSTARMFLLNDDYSVISNSSLMNSVWYLPTFWAVHVAALVSFAFAILSLFGRKIIEQILLLFKIGKIIYVVFGANSKSLCLVKSLMSNKNRLVIIIDENANEFVSEKIRDLGAILIKERLFDKGNIENKLLEKVGLLNKHLKKKIEFFLFEDDETYNISIAKALINVAKVNKVVTDRIGIYIQSNDKIVLRDIEEMLNNDVNYNVNIISEADLAARRLIQDYPIVERLEIDTNTAAIKDKDFTILIVGFGKIGREVLFKSLCNGQFISCDKKTIPFNAFVVDSQWENKSWKFRNIHPNIEKEYPGIVFEPYSSESDAFFKLLETKINDINYIVIATENDQNNLELAKSIQTYADTNNIKWGKKIMAVHMRNQSHLLNETNENTLFKYIKFFGEYESIFTEDIIINETMDNIAKQINKQYYKQNKSESNGSNTFDNWRELDLFYKNSNRAAAIHLKTKLALIGYEITNNNEVSEFDGNSTLDKYVNYEQLENLLRIEHLRWNAFHFVNGWTKFTNREIEQMKKNKGNELEYGDRKDKKKRKHSCLVSWEDLVYVSNTFIYKAKCSTELKEKYPNIIDFQLEDLKQTLDIPKSLSYAGIKVKKIERRSS